MVPDVVTATADASSRGLGEAQGACLESATCCAGTLALSVGALAARNGSAANEDADEQDGSRHGHQRDAPRRAADALAVPAGVGVPHSHGAECYAPAKGFPGNMSVWHGNPMGMGLSPISPSQRVRPAR